MQARKGAGLVEALQPYLTILILDGARLYLRDIFTHTAFYLDHLFYSCSVYLITRVTSPIPAFQFLELTVAQYSKMLGRTDSCPALGLK